MAWYIFLWQCFKESLKTPFDIVGYISFAILIFIGFVEWRKFKWSKHPKWRQFVKKSNWLIPLAIFVILIFMGMFSVSYNKYQNMNNQFMQLATQTSNEVHALQREVANYKLKTSPANNEQLSQQAWKTLSIDTSNLSGVYNNKNIIDCDIIGYGLIHFTDCSYLPPNQIRGKQSSFAVISPNDPIVTSGFLVIFQDCVFDNCRFWDTQFMGTENDIIEYKKAFNVVK